MYKLRFLLWYKSKLHLSVPYLVHIFLVRELNCIDHEMACKGCTEWESESTLLIW